MIEKFYPALSQQAIKQVLDIYANDPDYFTDPKCPYDPRVIELFTATNKERDFDTSDIKPLSDTDLQDEISALYQSLKSYGETARTSDNTADQNTYFRLSVGLLEKIIDMKERLTYVQNVNQFIEATLDAMADVLTPDQRNDFTARISRLIVGFHQPEQNPLDK